MLPGRYALVEGPLIPTPVNPAWRRLRRRALRFSLAAAFLLVLVLAHRPLLVGFAHLFRVNDPAPSDALILLLGDPSHRPLRAAELYHEGLAPLILMGDSLEDSQTGLRETTLTQQVLTRNKVPDEAIRVLPGNIVTSTRDEAVRVRDYVECHPGVKRVTVVTSTFHTARARWIFEKILRGTGVDVRVAAAPQKGLEETDWYKNDEGLVIYFSEAIKAVYYRLAY